MTRPLSQIARECLTSMNDQAQSTKRPTNARGKFPYAYPYLEAMLALNSVEENYYLDSGRSVVLYFLSNASTWKGEDAKRLKAELKDLLKK